MTDKDPSEDTNDSKKRSSIGVRKGCLYTIILFIIAIFVLVIGSEIKEHIDYAKEKMAKDDLMNTYKAAQAYFKENPKGEVTMSELEKRGLRKYPEVIIEIMNGWQSTIEIRSKHKSGKRSYQIGSRGSINRLRE